MYLLVDKWLLNFVLFMLNQFCSKYFTIDARLLLIYAGYLYSHCVKDGC